MFKNYTLNIELAGEYRLASDGMQYILLRRYVVDPTKSPSFNPATMSADLREEWREVGFYSLTTRGLTAVLNYVAIQSAADDRPDSLAEYAESIRKWTDELRKAIESRGIADDLGALIFRKGIYTPEKQNG